MMKIGFFGAGNMGGALARAVAKTGAEIRLYDLDEPKAAALAAELNGTSVSAELLLSACDLIFLGVKPQALPAAFTQLKPLLKKAKPKVWVSMAAGVPIQRIQDGLNGAPVIRIMPNTPVGVGKGMVLYACAGNVTQKAKDGFLKSMNRSGRLLEIPEQLIDAGCAVSGCGPAFVCLFAEALADGGVACGLSRAQARLLAAQTLSGTAELLLQENAVPAALKDAVCSPAGTTIEGVRALEENGFRGAVMDAVIAAFKKANQFT